MRKLISLFLAIGCLFSCMSMTAFATDTGVEGNDIDDESIATAIIIDKDGNLVDALDVSVTIEQTSNARSGGTTYTATYVARANKTDSDTSSKDGVIATATVTWNDILGTTNTLISVSGGWTANGETLSDRKVAYGSKSFTGETYTETKTPYINSFYYSPEDITGYTLYVSTSAKIGSTENTIYLYVQSKITT